MLDPSGRIKNSGRESLRQLGSSSVKVLARKNHRRGPAWESPGYPAAGFDRSTSVLHYSRAHWKSPESRVGRRGQEWGQSAAAPDRQWVLAAAGLRRSAAPIRSMAWRRRHWDRFLDWVQRQE